MNVVCLGGSRSTKPCVFPCKVAAGGDEGQLVCEAVAAAVALTRDRFLHCVLHSGDGKVLQIAL